MRLQVEKKRIYIIVIMVLISITNEYYGQSKKTEGHLMCYNIQNKQFTSFSDLVKWSYGNVSSYPYYVYYLGGFTNKTKDYFFQISNSSYLPFTDLLLIDNEGKYIGTLYSYFGDLDIMEPYLFVKTGIIPTNNGTWLLNGCLSNKFLTEQDTLSIPSLDFQYISGRIGDFYLLTKNFDFFSDFSQSLTHDYLVTLDESPLINFVDSLKIESKDSNDVLTPTKIFEISNNKYLLEIQGAVGICEYSDHKLLLEKKIFGLNNIYNYYYFDWTYKNNFVYFVQWHDYVKSLVKAKVDTINYTLTDSTTIFSGLTDWFAISPNGNFISSIVDDTLFVYSTIVDTFLAKQCLRDINYADYNIISTDQNVYLHAIDTETKIENNDLIPENYSLSQNYPNPFNPATTINYQIPLAGHVSLKVYDILGREVATLVNEEISAGNYEIKFDGSHLSSGVYFYTLQSGSFNETKKLILIK
jgi:hypothetical protein